MSISGCELVWGCGLLRLRLMRNVNELVLGGKCGKCSVDLEAASLL